jgi:cell wall-associated NlpC family hydrolase
VITSFIASILAAQVSIVATVDGKHQPSWVYAKIGQPVSLSAIVLNGQPQSYQWFSIEPVTRFTDNTTPSFHFADIEYKTTPLRSCENKAQCEIDFSEAYSSAQKGFEGLGTRSFQVIVTLKNGTVISTPGTDSVKYGGLTKDVMRVTFRKDDSLIGYATELFGTPYIFGSAGSDGRNQSDLLIGSDCADLIIYARRRSGHKATYTSSYALSDQAPPLKKNQVPKAGDVIHFSDMRHVGILYEDVAPVGVIDKNDLILHTCWDQPLVQAIGDTRCSGDAIRVLRFPN